MLSSTSGTLCSDFEWLLAQNFYHASSKADYWKNGVRTKVIEKYYSREKYVAETLSF